MRPRQFVPSWTGGPERGDFAMKPMKRPWALGLGVGVLAFSLFPFEGMNADWRSLGPGSIGSSSSSINKDSSQQTPGVRGCVLLGFFTDPMNPICIDECGLVPDCGGVVHKGVVIGPTAFLTIFRCKRSCKNGTEDFQQCEASWIVSEDGTARMVCKEGGKCNCNGCGCSQTNGPLEQSTICSCLGGGPVPGK